MQCCNVTKPNISFHQHRNVMFMSKPHSVMKFFPLSHCEEYYLMLQSDEHSLVIALGDIRGYSNVRM